MRRPSRPNLRDVWIVAALFVLPLVFFWQVTLGDKTLLPADNLYQFQPWAAYREQLGVPAVPHNSLLSDLVLENLPWKQFIRESLANREIPLWNPYIFAGVPFLAAGQNSAMYPFSVIYYVLPLDKAYGWFTVSQLWLAGLFGGMAFWVKQDALIGVGAGLLALAISRKFSWKLLAITMLMAAPWRVLVWTKNLPSDFAIAFVDLPLKTAQVAGALWHEAIAGGGYGWFWVIFVLVVVGRWRQLPDVSWLAVAVLLGLAGIFAVYWVSTPDVPALLKTSLARVLLNLFVPALLLVALLWPETRLLRRVLVVVTVWMGLVMAYHHTRTCVDLWREFGGKTLAQQRVLAVEPSLRLQIAHAFNSLPPGTPPTTATADGPTPAAH